jgi:hypothetical protein
MVVKHVQMVGLVGDPCEWEAKLAVLGDRVKVDWRAPDAEGFRFRPPSPPPSQAEKPGSPKPGDTPRKR